MNLTRRALLGAGAASALHAVAFNFKPGFASAKEGAEAIRLKKISVAELLNVTFQRIDLYNPRLNASSSNFARKPRLAPDRSMRRSPRGKSWGPTWRPSHLRADLESNQ